MRWTQLIVVACVACGGSASYQSFAAKCASPRSGTDPNTMQAYPDRQGTLADEKAWLLGWSEDLYLWYRELPTLDPAKFSTAIDYFDALRTPATTASGAPKDRFHFTYPTSVWEQLSQSGAAAGYGISWAEFAQAPPRLFIAAFIEPGSPAGNAGIARGAKLVAVDGVDVQNGDPNPLNAGLFPAGAGETHTLRVLDVGASAPRDVTMVSQVVTTPSVRDVTVVAGSVGYMNFNDHDAEAEQLLYNAFTQLKAQGVTDLVLDLRYNGGGYVDIASEAAFMIAGPARTAGKVFETALWNDKHPDRASSIGFNSASLGAPFPLPAGQPLPHLDLPRVFILTEAQTCSASEAIINGLRGVDVQVVLIGSTTCGKPYAFEPQDNCGTTYFTIQIQSVNAKGFGDYPDGFVPGGTATDGVPGCQVADDFTHALGDPAEAMLAAALQYRSNGTCPAPTSNPEAIRSMSRLSIGKSFLRGLRVVGK